MGDRMRQRGRRSADLEATDAIVDVTGKRSRLEPPALPGAERKIFLDLVNGCDPEHFRSADVFLLVRYVEAIALAERAAKEIRKGAVRRGRTSPWLAVQREAVKAMVALAIRLRLSPQSRIDAKTLGRQQLRTGPAPWEV
jgi:phage terminase small subunit